MKLKECILKYLKIYLRTKKANETYKQIKTLLNYYKGDKLIQD